MQDWTGSPLLELDLDDEVFMVFFLNETLSCPLAPLPFGKQLNTGRLVGVVFRGHRHDFAPRVIKAAVGGERTGQRVCVRSKEKHLKAEHEPQQAQRRLSVCVRVAD